MFFHRFFSLKLKNLLLNCPIFGEGYGCVNQSSLTINVATTPTVNFVASSLTLCAGNSSILSLSGADSYTITNPVLTTTVSAVLTPTASTTYTIVGLTGSCLSQETTLTLNVNALPVLGISNQTICVGNTATLSANNADAYIWSPNGETTSTIVASPTVTTTYSVVGTSSLTGCSSILTSVSAFVNPLPALNATVSSTAICSGATATLNITGADTYTWSTTETATTITVTPTTTTTYTATGTNTTTGCSNIANVTVNVTPTPTIGVAATATTICEGNSTTLTLTGATNYTVTNPSQTTTGTLTLSPSTQTTYTITGEQQGCASTTETITIDVNALPTLAVSNATTCAGTAVTLSANGADTYNWQPTGSTTNTTTVSPTTNTTYTVTGTNTVTGCTSTLTTVDVTVNQLPTVTATANPNTTCTTGTVNLTANTTATSYTWTTGNGVDNTNQNNQTITFPAATLTTGTYTYTVTVTDVNGCVSPQASTTISIIDVPNANFDLSDLVICQNENGTLTINTPQTGVSYDWNINGQTIPNTNPLTVPSTITNVSGTYTVNVIASLGTCTNTATNTLTVNALPTVALINAQVSACENTTAQLDVAGPNSTYTYNWTNGTNTTTGTNLTVNPLTQATQGTYTVTATDANGCTNRTTGKVDIKLCETFVPEFFSPNGDGKNDGFVIKNIENYPNNNLKIFNRWGNLVYQKDGYKNEFEGYANVGDAAGQEKLPAGTYYVILVYGDEETETYNGYLLLQY